MSLRGVPSFWVAALTTQITLSQDSFQRPGGRLGVTFGLIGYISWLLMEVLKANVQVLKLSFAGNLEERLTPVVVEFRTSLADDFSRFLLAHSITLTPGTVTIRVDGDRFIVHALTEEMGAGVPGDMETRLLKLFGGQDPAEGTDKDG